jgi:hypothetical protein
MKLFNGILIAILLSIAAVFLTAAVPVSESAAPAGTYKSTEKTMPATPLSVGTDLPYITETFDEKTLSAYSGLRNAVTRGMESITINTPLTYELWSLLIETADNADPLCFNIKTIRPEKRESDFTLHFTYTYSKNSYEKAVLAADTTADEIISSFAPETSEIKKLKAIYDDLRGRALYNEEAEYADNFYGVFRAGESGQEGFAEAFSYVCTKAGIDNTIVRKKYSDGAVLIVNRVTLSSGKSYYVCVPANDFFMKDEAFLEGVLE